MASAFGAVFTSTSRPCCHIGAPSLTRLDVLRTGSRKPVQAEQLGSRPSTAWPLRVATVEAEAASAPANALSRSPQTDKYAVVDLGGTQILVEEGRWYTCNRLQAEPGSKVQLGRVLALKDEGVFHVGRPYLESVIVEAEVLDDVKGPKLTIFKMNSKKHYRRKTGHRQPLTKFLITKIDKQ